MWQKRVKNKKIVFAVCAAVIVVIIVLLLALSNKTYEVTFYNIYETPPLASVSVTTKSNKSTFGNNQTAVEDVDITNRLTGILYTNSDYNPEA